MSGILRLHDGRIDLAQRRVIREAVEHRLTGQDVALLACLAARPGTCVARSTLLETVWGYHPASRTRAIDTAIRRLRAKIERDPSAPRHLLTVRGSGYLFSPATPAAHDDLIGRAALWATLHGAGGSLLTLVGPGGVGKTALARAFARVTAAPIIDLSGAVDLDGLLATVAAALDVPLLAGSTAAMIAQLGHALAARAAGWLVLDNLEHVQAPAARCLDTWLALAPSARVLTTSRVRLGLSAEVALPVPPLAPAAAAALFHRRAAAVRGQVDPADPALAPLLARLDHLPLAIELVAARTRTLDPAALLARIDAQRAALVRDPGAGGRHASVEAAIDWSWRRLTPQARDTLAAVSLFSGPFDLDAAEAIAGAPCADHLDALVARHLIARPDHRLCLLEGIRAFARERVPPARRRTLQIRHAEWFIARAATGAVEPGELLAAHAACLDHAPTHAVRAGLAVVEHLYQRGPRTTWAQIIEACARAAARLDAPDLVWRAHLERAALRRATGDLVGARQDADAALAAAGAQPDRRAAALRRQGEIERQRGELAAARACFAAAERCAHAPRVLAEVLRAQANLCLDLGEHAAAERHSARALALLRVAGDGAAEAVLLGNLGIVLLDAGRDAEAHAALDRALTLHRRLGDRRFVGVVLSNRAMLGHLMGDQAAARADAQAALAMHRSIGNRRFEGFARYTLAALDHEAGALSAALDALTAAIHIWQTVGERHFLAFGWVRLCLLEAERGARAAARIALETAAALDADAEALAWARLALEGGARSSPHPAPIRAFARINARLLAAMGRRYKT